MKPIVGQQLGYLQKRPPLFAQKIKTWILRIQWLIGIKIIALILSLWAMQWISNYVCGWQPVHTHTQHMNNKPFKPLRKQEYYIKIKCWENIESCACLKKHIF